MKKSIELAKIGCNVILDWGFWTRNERKEITDLYKQNNIDIQWHYIDIDDQMWYDNIEKRNKKVLEGKGGSDFFVDDGLLNKVLSKFEVPIQDEIDVWYKWR